MIDPKVAIFDLFDTILTTKSFRFDNGLKYLQSEIIGNNVTFEEVKAVEATLEFDWRKREITCVEFRFLNVIEELISHFNVKPEIAIEDIEYNSLLAMASEVKLVEEIKELFSYYQKQKIPMYVLSNSIFSIQALKRLLASVKVDHYFSEVYSSASFGIRKPHHKFFGLVVDKIKEDYPLIKNEEIAFVGNDYFKDIIGAKAYGLRPIWYNVDNYDDILNFKVESIINYYQISHKENEKEELDAYDRNGNKLNYTLIRGEPHLAGVFHQVVEVITIFDNHKILLTQRALNKTYPLYYEITSGSVKKGEKVVEGAIRELKEETNLDVLEQDLIFLKDVFLFSAIFKVFVHFTKAKQIDVKLNELETMNYKIVTIEELETLIANNEFIGGKRYFEYKDLLLEKIKTRN